MNTTKISVTKRWRNMKLNRKCKFCIFINHISINNITKKYHEYECLYKDKKVIPDIPRPFCNCFRINKKLCEEIDKVFYLGLTPSEAKKETSNKKIIYNGG